MGSIRRARAGQEVLMYSQGVTIKNTFIFMADRWKQWDLADSRYIWLPLAFDAKGKPVITWQED